MKISLIQFECQNGKGLFYCQYSQETARRMVDFCPVCGSKQVKATGRVYDAIDETAFIQAVA